MIELPSWLQAIAAVLGAWTLASVLAAVPIIWCFRLQGAANEAAAGEARRQGWLAARRGVVLR